MPAVLIREAVPADARAMARVHVDSWRTTYRGIIADSVLDELSYELRERNWHSALTEHSDRNFIHVVESDDGRVVGFVAAGKGREGRPDFQAEVFAIYVLQEFHGRGCGKALMLASAERLLQEGMRSMLLWVLVENPSRGFYERLGGKRLEEKQITIDGESLTEVAYGWADLQDLLARPPSAGRT
jgi:ribosomal protein S18 acetylase RimI-like enzyme